MTSRPDSMDSMDSIAEELARSFARRADEHDRTGAFPTADVNELRASGLLGLLVPRHLGGMGGSFADYVRIAMRLARGNGATALLFNMHASVTGALAGIPDDVARSLGVPDSFFATRDSLLRRAAEGAVFGVAISERGSGSRLSAMRTSYVRDGEGFRIDGHKSTCSGAGHLDGYLIAARDGSVAESAPPQISYFILTPDQIGTVTETWEPLGMRATSSNGFTIDASVGADALVGVEGVAVLLAYAMPEWLVASYAAVYVGVAQSALDAAVAYVKRASVFEPADAAGASQVPLSTSPWVRQRIGRAEAQVEAARLVMEDAARQVDAAPGSPSTIRSIYRAKLIAGDTAFAVAASLTEACGLGATMRSSPLERILRDARSGALMPPSSDIAANVVGSSTLDVDLGSGLGARPW